jgi:fluoride exporter
MLVWIAVGAGGALGSLARHAVNRLVQHEWPLLRFPLATAVVNIAGCAVIGLLAGLIASGRLPMRQPWREFVFVGVLGGFTTFSTFGFETISLVRTGEGARALANVAVQVIVGLGALYAGLAVTQRP